MSRSRRTTWQDIDDDNELIIIVSKVKVLKLLIKKFSLLLFKFYVFIKDY